MILKDSVNAAVLKMKDSYKAYEWILKNKDSIEKVKASSLEELRANLIIEEVDRYINVVDEMLKNPPNPFSLINFD